MSRTHAPLLLDYSVKETLLAFRGHIAAAARNSSLTNVNQLTWLKKVSRILEENGGRRERRERERESGVKAADWEREREEEKDSSTYLGCVRTLLMTLRKK